MPDTRSDQSRAIAEIRAGLLFFGYDLSSLPDQQIANAVHAMQRAIRRAGVTVEEADRAIRALLPR